MTLLVFPHVCTTGRVVAIIDAHGGCFVLNLLLNNMK